MKLDLVFESIPTVVVSEYGYRPGPTFATHPIAHSVSFTSDDFGFLQDIDLVVLTKSVLGQPPYFFTPL
jgi:hypothetical protein